jgi:hypothetical protein
MNLIVGYLDPFYTYIFGCFIWLFIFSLVLGFLIRYLVAKKGTKEESDKRKNHADP